MQEESGTRSYLYGLEHANHYFTQGESFGKNIFTNAFPVALAVYMDVELGLAPNFIKACIDEDGHACVGHVTAPLAEMLGISSQDAYWAFEDSFSGYDAFATGTANRSDLVVKDRHTQKELRAFEVKLVTAPTSGTASRPREEQSCEIVVRPPTIEQMCFSIAASYGPDRRHSLDDMIAAELEHPMDYEWANEGFMLGKLPRVLAAAERIVEQGVDVQTPFVLNALWRTQGKSSIFDDECFEVFFWSDMAFLQLFTNEARRAIEGGKKKVGRPERSVIWLVKSLFDYSVQGKVTFAKAHGELTYGGQTDKAGAFSGNSVMGLLGYRNFYHPRVGKKAYREIVRPEGIALLSPERRLDGFIKADYDYAAIRLD